MMQNLNFSLLDEPIKCQNLTAFVIEDVNVFASTVREIYRYEECSSLKLFDEKYKPLKPSELMIITDILGYDINSSATLKLIYGDLEKQLNEKPEVKSMIEKLTATISELVGYELLDHELDLQEDEITVQELFKALGIKIETESDTIFEKIYEILQVFKYLSKKKLLIFINLCSYVTTEELRELSSYVSLYNMDVLLIEPRMLKGCSQYILDEDYFLTFENMV